MQKYPLGQIVLVKLKGRICVCVLKGVLLLFTLYTTMFEFFSSIMHYLCNSKKKLKNR